ncbi:MAG TPA: VCBS repeat-containing protein [Steroidobacteraceae bacterium]|nr:VCBS repeat-containing protein [Steroidobacteraceae bacterium]
MGLSRLLGVGMVLLPLLAACGDDHGCWNCGYAGPGPGGGTGCGSDCSGVETEISLGLVAGNFAGNGFASIIGTSTTPTTANRNAGNLKTYLATAAGAYAAPLLTSDGDDPLYLASADLNGDHLPDVVSASAADGTLSVFLNTTQTPGTFAAPIVLKSPGASQVAIADMNGDGMPDLISADYNVSLFLQTSPGVFAAPVSLYPGGANWVAVGDLNGDGIPDIALADAVGVKLLMHTGAAGSTTYAAPVSVFTQTRNGAVSGGNVIAIADVNGDGFNDLVITDPGPSGNASPTVSVLIQDSSHPGQFLAPVVYAIAPYSIVTSIVVTDVNGDGLPDLVIGGTTATSVLQQNASPRGTFAAATNYATPNANEIAVADVNGDGKPDIVVATGPAQTISNGVQPNVPGVLLQSTTSPGTFMALQALP